MSFVRRAYPLLRPAALIVLAGITIGHAAGTPKKTVIVLSLDEFVRLAEKNSLRSQIAGANFYSSRWGWKAARRSLTWPTLNAEMTKKSEFSDDDIGSETDTRTKQGNLTLSQPFLTGTKLSLAGTWTDSKTTLDSASLSTTSYSKSLPNFTASVSQPLFVFTGNPSLRSRKQANLQWSNDQDSYRSETFSIEFDARSRYYNLLLQMETTTVEKKKLESGQLVNEVTRALVRAGKLAEVEAVRSDIRIKKDFRRVQNSESSLEKALNQAKDFLYLDPKTEIQLTSKLEYKAFRIPVENIITAAMENNPDLQISKRAVELSELSLKNTREGNRPQLNAIGSYTVTRDRSDESLPLDPTSWTVQLGMDWPIFDANQTRLKTLQAEASLENSKRSLENQSRQLKVDVENAYLELKRAEEQITDFEPQRISAQRNVTAIRLQYRNGLTRLTDVFDAENEMRDLELEYLNLLVNFNSSRDRLKMLVGKDLENINGEAK